MPEIGPQMPSVRIGAQTEVNPEFEKLKNQFQVMKQIIEKDEKECDDIRLDIASMTVEKEKLPEIITSVGNEMTKLE